GKPGTTDDRIGLSAAHTADLTLAVAGTGSQGCDLEPVRDRPKAVWRDLLGAEGYRLAVLIGRETGGDEATAATRVWTAHECRKKAEMTADSALTLEGNPGSGWVTLACGRYLVATFLAHIRGVPAPVVMAALLEKQICEPTNTAMW